MNHLKLFVFLFLFPLGLSAQVDLSYFPHYNADLMEDLGVSEAQLQQINVLNQEIGKRKQTLHDALLYRPDLEAGLEKLDHEKLAALQTILTAAQKQAYQQFNTDIETEQRTTDLKRYKDMYLDVYRYLKINGEQAQRLADLEIAVRDGEQKSASYSDLKTNLLKEILSPKQWKKYSKKRKKERFETKTIPTNTSTDVAKLLEDKNKALKHLKEVYLPQRSKIRNSLEQQLSAQDRQTIAALRKLYNTQLSERSNKTYTGNSIELGQLFDELLTLRGKHIIDQTYYVKNVVHHDRPTFEQAKALGIKYDELIDALQPQLHALEEARFGGKEDLFMRGMPIDAKSKTERVELIRNIAFLLISETDEQVLSANMHQLKAYPLPASSQQTLEFELKKAGDVRIELLDAQGKLVEVLLEETLSSGTHQREIALDKVNAAIFFYRIESADGTSLFKSLKVQ